MDILAFNPAAESLDAFNGRLHARCYDSFITGVVASPFRDGLVLSLTEAADLPVSGLVFSAWVVDMRSREAQLSPEAHLLAALTTLRALHAADSPYVPVEAQVIAGPSGEAYTVFKIVRGQWLPPEGDDG